MTIEYTEITTDFHYINFSDNISGTSLYKCFIENTDS